jgi:L-alanine-DL-glutamate epimerase-like enolase superfamily enzyme
VVTRRYRNIVSALKKLGVELIEQPFPADADDTLETLEHPIPVCADESCHTTDDLSRLRIATTQSTSSSTKPAA